MRSRSRPFRSAISRIHEPGLDTLVIHSQRLGRLQFSTNAADGVAHSELIFLAVGTPPDEDR